MPSTYARRFLSTQERFWSQVEAVGVCWLWRGASVKKPNGRYGVFSIGSRTDGTRRSVKAHTFIYEVLIGPFPAGLVPDHRCRVTLCVNPWHIEPVTDGENIRRGLAGANERAKEACPTGHPYDEENTIRTAKGHRRCRTCCNRRLREYRARQHV